MNVLEVSAGFLPKLSTTPSSAQALLKGSMLVSSFLDYLLSMVMAASIANSCGIF